MKHLKFVLFVDVEVVKGAIPWLLEFVGKVGIDWDLEPGSTVFSNAFLKFACVEDVVAFKLKYRI
jgi:hypothetical protein